MMERVLTYLLTYLWVRVPFSVFLPRVEPEGRTAVALLRRMLFDRCLAQSCAASERGSIYLPHFARTPTPTTRADTVPWRHSPTLR